MTQDELMRRIDKSESDFRNNKKQSSLELTKHAMNLAQSSLEEDWNDENDKHWESFL